MSLFFSGWLFHCLEHSFCLRKPALSSNYMSHRAMRFVIHHAPVWMECLLARSSQGFRWLPKEQDLDCLASTVSLALSTLPGIRLYPENLGCLRTMRVNAFFILSFPFKSFKTMSTPMKSDLFNVPCNRQNWPRALALKQVCLVFSRWNFHILFY